MRWEPLVIILLMASLCGLLIVTTVRRTRTRWFALLVLGYFTSLGAILFTPLAFTGTAVYIMPAGLGRVNLTHLDMFNLGFFENILMTIPLGMLIKWVLPKISMWGVTILGIFAGSSFETIQYILSHHWLINRSSDINDVISNTMGVVVGGIAIAVYYRIAAKHRQRPQAIA